MPSPQESKDPAELVATLLDSTNVLEFVPRKVLIDAIGPELASRFLMDLPQYVSVNVEQVLMTVRAFKPELLSPPEKPNV